MAVKPRPALQDIHGWLAETLRFPLRPWLRPLILAAALISGLASASLMVLPPILAGLLALFTMVTLWILALRVASRILLATAEGAGLERHYRDFDLPEYQALRQIVLWILIAVILSGLNQAFGPIGLVLGLLASTALLPALTLLVAMNNAIDSCLQGSCWRELKARVDAPGYRRLSLLFLFLALVYLGLDGLSSALLPLPLASGVVMAAWVYALWAWFYALGVALCLTREPSGHVEEPVAESVEALAKRLSDSGGTLDDHRRLVRALEQQGDQAGLLAHGPGYVSALLLSFDRVPEAVERAAALSALSSEFALDIPSSQLKLIEAARRFGHPELVLDLVSAYLKKWPAAPGGRAARLIACEVDAAAPGVRSVTWFREVINEDLSEADRARVKAFAPAYLDP